MKKHFLLLCLLVASFTSAQARDWYISVTGSDANDGKTPVTSVRTLQYVADRVNPGDVVLISSGEYTSPDENSVVKISRSGKPGKWITWKAMPGHKPVIHPHGWNGILVNGSYHIFDGLTIKGCNDSIPLKMAIDDSKKETVSGFYNTNGIYVNGRLNDINNKPHHVVIKNCCIHDCAGGGIVLIETDYITVDNNDVYNNAWFSRYGCSGITTLHLWSYDHKPGYHIAITNNRVWNNCGLVPWGEVGRLSDGNGIILDVSNHGDEDWANMDNNIRISDAVKREQKHDPRPVWDNWILVARNISVFNGGSGIHAFRASNIDIVNNTLCYNGSVMDYPELFAGLSHDVNFYNNVILPRPGGKITSNVGNARVNWDYNVYPTPQNFMHGPHDIVADPLITNPQKDIRLGDFSLRDCSPAKNAAMNKQWQYTTLPNGDPDVIFSKNMGWY